MRDLRHEADRAQQPCAVATRIEAVDVTEGQTVRAGDILFIGLLRHLIAHPGNLGHGLLSGLADPRIARALIAIHTYPQNRWTLESLAEEAGMSRTAFANIFRDVMSETPGRYLSAFRLAIAQRAVHLGKGLKAAARDAGYTNPSALSRALSRASAPVV